MCVVRARTTHPPTASCEADFVGAGVTPPAYVIGLRRASRRDTPLKRGVIPAFPLGSIVALSGKRIGWKLTSVQTPVM